MVVVSTPIIGPVMRTAASGVALHGRHLNEVSAGTVGEFTAAIADSSINKILLEAGTYELTSDVCDGYSAVCIDRALTIEAEVPGAMVLNAMGARRVFHVQSGGMVKLVGLNITGGEAYSRCERCLDWGGGGVYVAPNGVANFEGCNIHDNTATYRGPGGGVFVSSNGVANFEGCNIHGHIAATGGGLYISGTATLTNTTVYSNWAYSGGGVVVNSNGVANLVGCNVHDNLAETAGGFYIHGTATLTNTNVYSNLATESGYGWGGGLNIKGTATLTNTNVYSNVAGWGGGVFVDSNGVANLEGCNIHDNIVGSAYAKSVSACILNLPRRFLHCPLN